LQWLPDFRAGDNNAPSQTDWESGALRDLDDEIRNIKSVVRSWSVPSDNKVWEQVEKPNTYQLQQHATLGFALKVEFIDIRNRLEKLQVLKAKRGSDMRYYVIVDWALEGSHTLIALRSLPYQFTVQWNSISGDVLTSLFSIAEPPFTGPFTGYVAGSPPPTGKQGMAIYDNIGAMLMSNGVCDSINDDSFFSYFNMPGLLQQGRLTAASAVKQTWALNVYPNISGIIGSGAPYNPDVFVDQIWLGSRPSLFAKTNQSGQAIVNGNGTSGPYALSNYARAEYDTNYSLLLQLKATSIAAPSDQQLTYRATKSTTNFTIDFAAVIPAGQTVTFDWMVNR
jgi:hypothetical protein